MAGHEHQREDVVVDPVRVPEQAVRLRGWRQTRRNLTLGERSQVLIPDLERGLERAGNSRTPSEVKNQTWWKSLRAIGQELDVTSAFREYR